jgi:hypothetical protein
MTSVSTPATDSRPRERKKERKKENSANTRSYIRSPALVSFDLFCIVFPCFYPVAPARSVLLTISSSSR